MVLLKVVLLALFLACLFLVLVLIEKKKQLAKLIKKNENIKDYIDYVVSDIKFLREEKDKYKSF